MAVRVNSFTAWDYVVFVATLLVSIVIGIYFAFRSRNKNTQGEYLMGSRSMALLPVSISLVVSFKSAILILGTPAEMYMAGTQYYLYAYGQALGAIAAAVLFVPLLYPLGITSSLEYLQLRYNSRYVRMMGSFLLILNQITYMGIAAYAPSTALDAVTGFPDWATILIIGFVGTLYTCLGGMKAVVWSDVFQSVVMVAGILAIIIQGSIKVGGIEAVWKINERWDRIQFFNFDPDPTLRQNFWALTLGGMVLWIGNFGISQASVQRYNSVTTLRKAQWAVVINGLSGIVLYTLCCLTGIVVFAFYANKNCDINGQKLVDNGNQIVPFFVMDTLNYPTIPGLFISSLFSGALSSVSSSLNAMAAITWEDFLKPHFDTKLTESQKTRLTKATVGGKGREDETDKKDGADNTVVLLGALSIAVSFTVRNLSGTVLEAATSLIGASGAPLLGMFVLASMFPWANRVGTIIGAILGLAVGLWLAIGSYVADLPRERLPFPNSTCSEYLPNVTASLTTMASATSAMTTAAAMTTEMSAAGDGRSGLDTFYSISYLLYSTVGFVTCVITGLIISLLTGPTPFYDVPLKYQIPIFSRIFCCLPKSAKRFLQCNRDFMDPEELLGELNDSSNENSPTVYSSDKMKAVFDNPVFVLEDKPAKRD